MSNRLFFTENPMMYFYLFLIWGEGQQIQFQGVYGRYQRCYMQLCFQSVLVKGNILAYFSLKNTYPVDVDFKVLMNPITVKHTCTSSTLRCVCISSTTVFQDLKIVEQSLQVDSFLWHAMKDSRLNNYNHLYLQSCSFLL